MIPDSPSPRARPGAGWLSVALLAVLLLGVAVRLVSPAIILDIASLWPVGVVLVALGWLLKRIRPDGFFGTVPVVGLLMFSWIAVTAAFHFAELPGLPSRSADLRGPLAHEARFDTFTVELGAGQLDVTSAEGNHAYQVDMMRGGGGAGVPVAVESQGPSGGAVNVVDARQPLPGNLGVTVADNTWLRFSGWEVTLHPGTAWNLTLAGPEISADLRGLPISALSVNGGGSVRLGTSSEPVPVVINGAFTVEVPPQTSMMVEGAAIVPEDWTVVDDAAWFGQPETGWQIQVIEGGSVQVVAASG